MKPISGYCDACHRNRIPVTKAGRYVPHTTWAGAICPNSGERLPWWERAGLSEGWNFLGGRLYKGVTGRATAEGAQWDAEYREDHEASRYVDPLHKELVPGVDYIGIDLSTRGPRMSQAEMAAAATAIAENVSMTLMPLLVQACQHASNESNAALAIAGGAAAERAHQISQLLLGIRDDLESCTGMAGHVVNLAESLSVILGGS